MNLLDVDAVGLDPPLHLKPGLPERPCNSGNVPAVLSQQTENFLAPPLITVAELQLASIAGEDFRSRLWWRPRLRLRRRRAERLGQMRQPDAFAPRQNGSPGDARFQPADVPPPVVQKQGARCGATYTDLVLTTCRV